MSTNEPHSHIFDAKPRLHYLSGIPRGASA